MVAAALAAGSCNDGTIREICQERAQRFQMHVDVARAELMPANRAIASTGAETESPTSLSAAEREQWAEWSLDRLLEVQDYLDRLEEYPKFKSEGRTLMLASNELVMMYSQATKGDRLGMHESLLKVESLAMPALKKTCNEL